MRWPIGIERHPGFIGQLCTQVHGECEEPARENIAHNTLPYKFAWMLLLPHTGQGRGRPWQQRRDRAGKASFDVAMGAAHRC